MEGILIHLLRTFNPILRPVYFDWSEFLSSAETFQWRFNSKFL